MGGQNCIYCVGHKSIQIFTFGMALLSPLEPYVACATAMIGRPSQLPGFGLCQHDLARVHVVTRSMQREQR